ncbi:shikimate kinase [Actinobaculum suis]|uniref:shikimate kinase n=1 Tax=Actinobaculum suis TaxID=1657 RepID=UPI00066FF70D|nr:shikimate kinase [Actinobaculum suis]KMY23696.1 hypothetical protein ACU19_02750 [Actinobaculum suis]OCA93783.1 hypothetical protein ACU20_08075 [Actinobaculum suis]OCA94076.1 hypothetical protein ACU21_08030 [Actinobaculum suis]
MTVRAVIIGLPGAGKSTVGRLLARELGVPFADSDQLIVEATGRSIPDIFADDGEAGFRQIEEKEIARALREFGGVLSLGGGAILSPQTRQNLRGHHTILIEAPQAELLRRVTNSRTKRPLLENNPEENLARLTVERAPLYEEVATIRVQSGPEPVRGVVVQALEKLQEAEAQETNAEKDN